MHSFKIEAQELGGRANHLEQKMGEFASSYNTLVNAHNEQDDEMMWLKAKTADLEDSSHRKHVKMWGIPETIQLAQLQLYAASLCKLCCHLYPSPT